MVGGSDTGASLEKGRGSLRTVTPVPEIDVIDAQIACYMNAGVDGARRKSRA